MIYRVGDAMEAVFAVNDCRKLPRLGILGHVWIRICRDEQNARWNLPVVPNLVPTLRPAWERDDVASGTSSQTFLASSLMTNDEILGSERSDTLRGHRAPTRDHDHCDRSR